MDQLAEGDLEVPRDGLRLARTLGGDLLKEWIERLLDEVLLHACAVGHAAVAWDWCADGTEGQLGQVHGLTDGERAGFVGLDDKEAPAHGVATAILHRRAEDVEPNRGLGLEVVEDG